MKVASVCEFSGRVRDAFIRQGHDAVSIDVIPSESAFGPHIIDDARNINYTSFDLVIAFPPCTYLSTVSVHCTKETEKRADALDFVRFLMNLPVEHLAIENPQSIISTHIRKPDQVIHPWYFGDPYTKRTCLWLKNLPRLKATDIVRPIGSLVDIPSPRSQRSKFRSRISRYIAAAMAEQWGVQ